jgi:lysozyme
VNAGPAAYKLLKAFEGCKLLPYQDGGGVWTVGYGSTNDVHPGEAITQAEAESRLAEEVHIAENCVNAHVDCPLTQAEFDALICFVFNVGCTAFGKSTLVKLLNEGRYEAAAEEFPKWCHDNGKVIEGLRRRRLAEKELFESAG